MFGRWKPAGPACLDNNADNGTESCDAWGHCSVHSVNVVSCKKAPWCFTTPGKPPDLHCWLNANVRLGNAISFSLDGYGIWEHYSYWQWAQSSQQELQQAFENAWNWVAAGIATPFAGPPLPDPLVNQHILGDNDPMQTYVDKDTAWKWYVASVGHSLALEIAGIVPWSMCRYSGEALQSLISGGNLSPVTPDGTYHLDDSVLSTPAHPVEMYRFLLQNSLLGPTPVSTIANTVEWSTQLYHANNGLTAKTAWDTWQYRGAPPVSRIISGTVAADLPQFGVQHWTMGCIGTTGFLHSILRTANIPVLDSNDRDSGAHSLPHFMAEGLYLSHGDDPYRYGGWITLPQPPVGSLLIDEAQFGAWFKQGSWTGYNNVGRRGKELILQYPSDEMLARYCQDTKDGNHHASGSTYTFYGFPRLYTVAQLEAMGFYATLDAKLPQAGGCPAVCAKFPFSCPSGGGP